MRSRRQQPRFGNLKRFDPFCSNWGIGRGGAIDRFYIDRFIKRELVQASGAFLECGGQRYRKFVRSSNISLYEVVDIDPSVRGVTICCDIQSLRHFKHSHFDVVVCTQVLQYVEKPELAIEEFRRVLKRGGRLLLTAPFVEKDCGKLGDRWRFTRREVSFLLRTFKESEVTVGGNLFTSACYWMGLGINDVDVADLKRTDDCFYQVVLAKAIK